MPLGDISVGIKWDSTTVSDQEADVDFDIIPNANDTFTVKYVPPAAGKLTVKVLFTDKVLKSNHGRVHVKDVDDVFRVLTRFVLVTQEVQHSPFIVKVDPSHDASKVKAEGPGLARAGEPLHFNVSAFVFI